MKKLIAISLLSLHLFSLYGHLALYAYCVYESNRFFNEQISKDKYNVGDLVEMKIPVHMPTIEDWKEYSYVSGQVQFRNNSYNYVKIKMTRDTVYLMCVPNYSTTKLIGENIIDARKVADIPLNKKEHVPFGKVSILSDYNCQVLQFKFAVPVKILMKANNNSQAGIIKSSICSPGQPPDRLNFLS